jgi:hypothetical protein
MPAWAHPAGALVLSASAGPLWIGPRPRWHVRGSNRLRRERTRPADHCGRDPGRGPASARVLTGGAGRSGPGRRWGGWLCRRCDDARLRWRHRAPRLQGRGLRRSLPRFFHAQTKARGYEPSSGRRARGQLRRFCRRCRSRHRYFDRWCRGRSWRLENRRFRRSFRENYRFWGLDHSRWWRRHGLRSGFPHLFRFSHEWPTGCR